MKAVLEFNLDDPSDRLAHTRAVKSTDAYIALFEIANEVFRPARKHGYKDQAIQDIVENHPPSEDVIGKLEEMFHQILESNGINLNDLE